MARAEFWDLRTAYAFRSKRGDLIISSLCQCQEGCWRSLHSGRSPHDGCERFCTFSLTRNSNGLCNYCKVNVCTITVTFSVIVISSCSLTDHHHHYELYVRPSYYHTICQSTCFNGCAAVLLLHVLALLLDTVDVLWFHAC